MEGPCLASSEVNKAGSPELSHTGKSGSFHLAVFPNTKGWADFLTIAVFQGPRVWGKFDFISAQM